MKTYKNKYRGYQIVIEEVNQDRVDYKILDINKSLVEDTEGFCITVEEAMELCKETIDDIIDEKKNI